MGAVMNLHATQKDAAAIKKAADDFAKDGRFEVSVRLAATDALLAAGDRAGAEQELSTVTDSLQSTGVPSAGDPGGGDAELDHAGGSRSARRRC